VSDDGASFASGGSIPPRLRIVYARVTRRGKRVLPLFRWKSSRRPPADVGTIRTVAAAPPIRELSMESGSHFLEDLRLQYEAARSASHPDTVKEDFQTIDTRLRNAFRWLEKAVTYLDGVKPPLQHDFALASGAGFQSPRFARGSVTQHERRIVGFPVLDEINIYYQISASGNLDLEPAPGNAESMQKMLDDAGLQFARSEVEDAAGHVHRCVISVRPDIPASVLFRADYGTGRVVVTLVNVDRLERVALDFDSSAIDEPMLEDLVRLIMGAKSSFLLRAPLAGVHGNMGRVGSR
jgi:hypothetical protein